MTFETFFRFVSYTAVLCGFLSLWVSGSFGFAISALFLCVMIAAWFIEDSRWQITEKIGTALIVLALPAFYLAWRFQFITPSGNETWIAGILARMILSLMAVKLLQRKSDRDWIFIYLMSFFEVLLAAGLSISALYFASFLLYLLVTVSAVIAFEIRKTARNVEQKIKGEATKERDSTSEMSGSVAPRRLPSTAVVLIVLIAAVAIPLFFMLPRVGGAGFGGSQGGLSTSSGFSDTVKLGGIGRIQQNDEVVMRVKSEGVTPPEDGLYLRGVALDTFNNQAWSKSKTGPKEPFVRGEREFIQVDFPVGRDNISIQTIYLEPMDTSVLFGLPRIVAVQGGFPAVYKDAFGSLSYQRSLERMSYKVFSDRSLPSDYKLRADEQPYTADVQNYRSLPPVFDQRIIDLATRIAARSKNRFDKARAIEAYLQTNYGYTLEQKASGDEPLSDFLFNVREGHCEYFATAMAMMLRTQGIASRIVNGFHGGDYNDTADMTVVRQKNAHAWVEVYFPKENVWVPFDPTPLSGRPGDNAAAGITGRISKYLEAFEAFWIQYFVAFDDQEQRSLARGLRDGFANYSLQITTFMGHAQDIIAEWWREARGEKGFESSLTAIFTAIVYVVAAASGLLLLGLFVRRIVKSGVWSRIRGLLFAKRGSSVVEFYEKMLTTLAAKGFVKDPYLTPLEFANAVGVPEAVFITEKYNRVRFGEKELSKNEADQIDSWLNDLFATNYTNVTNEKEK